MEMAAPSIFLKRNKKNGKRNMNGKSIKLQRKMKLLRKYYNKRNEEQNGKH